MNLFSKKIRDLQIGLLLSIKTILRNNNRTKINIDNVCDPTRVFWFDNSGFIYEGQVLTVELQGNELSIKIDTHDSPVTVYEGDFALENVSWLDSIRSNILEVLSGHIHICAECGKPINRGYSIDGTEWYCSIKCLQNNCSAEEWEKNIGDGKKVKYEEWEEDSCIEPLTPDNN